VGFFRFGGFIYVFVVFYSYNLDSLDWNMFLIGKILIGTNIVNKKIWDKIYI
jgi:hypothetical protein